jgi:hypothetical protein
VNASLSVSYLLLKRLHRNKTLRKTISDFFRIGEEPGKSEIGEGAFFYATFAPVFVGFFLRCFGQFSGIVLAKATRGSAG